MDIFTAFHNKSLKKKLKYRKSPPTTHGKREAQSTDKRQVVLPTRPQKGTTAGQEEGPETQELIKTLSKRKVYPASPAPHTQAQMKREHVSKENKHTIWKKQSLQGQMLAYSVWHQEYSRPNNQDSNHSQKSQGKPPADRL